MRTLESTPIATPAGHYIYDISLTKAGRAKLEQAIEYWYNGGYAIENGWTNAYDFDSEFFLYSHASLDDWVLDLESEAASLEVHPACRFEEYGAIQDIHFVEGIDYVIEFRTLASIKRVDSTELDQLKRLTAILEETHTVFEKELNRLGW